MNFFIDNSFRAFYVAPMSYDSEFINLSNISNDELLNVIQNAHDILQGSFKNDVYFLMIAIFELVEARKIRLNEKVQFKYYGES